MRAKLLLVMSMVTMVVGILASSAAASTATVSPGGATSGTAPASQWVFSTQARTFGCTSTGMNATLGSSSGSLPLTISSNVQLAVTGCVVTGGLTYTFNCSAVGVFTVTGLTTAGLTPGRIGLQCQTSLSGTCAVIISGDVGVTYINSPSTLRVTGTSTTERLRATRAPRSTCSELVSEPVVVFRGATTVPLDFAVRPLTTLDAI
jgi:hypothetical protein